MKWEEHSLCDTCVQKYVIWIWSGVNTGQTPVKGHSIRCPKSSKLSGALKSKGDLRNILHGGGWVLQYLGMGKRWGDSLLLFHTSTYPRLLPSAASTQCIHLYTIVLAANSPVLLLDLLVSLSRHLATWAWPTGHFRSATLSAPQAQDGYASASAFVKAKGLGSLTPGVWIFPFLLEFTENHTQIKIHSESQTGWINFWGIDAEVFRKFPSNISWK